MADNTNITVTTSVSDILNASASNDTSTTTFTQPKRRGRPPKNPELAAQKKAEKEAKKKAEQEKRQKDQENWKATQAQKKDKSNPDYKDTRTDVKETCINCCSGDDFCTFYSSEVWGKNLARKMLQEHPDEVKLVFEDPEDGAIEIKAPLACIKFFRFPNRRDLTDEQRDELRNRIKKAHEARKEKLNKDKENEENDINENEEV